MAQQTHDRPQDGRFIPLFASGTAQPPANPYIYAVKEGIVTILNREDFGPMKVEGSVATYAQLLSATASEDDADPDGGSNGDGEDHSLEDEETIEQAARMVSQGHEDSGVEDADESEQMGPVVSHPVPQSINSSQGDGAEPAAMGAEVSREDPHEALRRASLPSSGDEAAQAQFDAERKRLEARKQRQLERLARRKANRKGNRGDGAVQPPAASNSAQRDLQGMTEASHVATETWSNRDEEMDRRDGSEAEAAAAGDEDAFPAPGRANAAEQP